MPGGENPTRRGQLRMIGVYLSIYAAYGTFVPYISVFLKRKGMSDFQVGALSAVGPILTFVSPILWGLACDAMGSRRKPLALTMVLSGLTFPALLVVDGFWMMMAVLVLFNFFFRPSLSMGDAAALEFVEASKHDYGRLRMWGGIGFVIPLGVLSLFMGKESGESVAPERLAPMFAGYFVCATLAAVSALRLPEQRPAHFTNILKWHILRRVLSPNILLLVLCGSVHAAVMMTYYVFLPIRLDELGVADNFKSLFWAIAVIPEIGFFYFVGSISRKVGKKWLFVMGISASAVRLAIFASAENYWLIGLGQTLHSLSFAASYVATVTLVDGEVPGRLRTTGQTFAYGVGTGLGGTVGLLLGGKMADLWGIPTLFGLASVVTLVVALVAMIFLKERVVERVSGGTPQQPV